MPWYHFLQYQLQDALGVCKLTTRENSAPLLNELLRGTNATDFSNNYFRQHNFLSLAPGFALHKSSQRMPGLLNETCFQRTRGKHFPVPAQLCWCHSQTLLARTLSAALASLFCVKEPTTGLFWLPVFGLHQARISVLSVTSWHLLSVWERVGSH